MQRLEIIYLTNIFHGSALPLVDEAHYFEINVKSCDDERYVEAVGYDADGQADGQHVVPLALVRSVSARPIEEPIDPAPVPEGLTGVTEAN